MSGGRTHQLVIMRHAKSAWGDSTVLDVDRPLNDRGHRAAARMAQWLGEQQLIPDRVVSSAAERTRQTVGYVVDHLGIDPAAVSFHKKLYLAGADSWLAAIRNEPEATETLLICGHNPGFDDLVVRLSTEEPPRSTSGKLMTTAAIAHLRFSVPWAEVANGAGGLVDLARPREL